MCHPRRKMLLYLVVSHDSRGIQRLPPTVAVGTLRTSLQISQPVLGTGARSTKR